MQEKWNADQGEEASYNPKETEPNFLVSSLCLGPVKIKHTPAPSKNSQNENKKCKIEDD